MDINRESSSDWIQLNRYMILSGALLVGFFILGQINFLIFHSLGEMLSIAIAWSVFTLSWNTQKIVRNDNLLLLGIAYLSVGLMDSLHMLAYKGLGVYSPEFAANYATQLWIASRLVETLSLLLFASSFRRHLNPWYLLSGYAGITTGLLMSIFYWRIFPTCYIEGYGLTPFKVGAEYFIVLALISTVIIIHKNRNLLDRKVYLLMVGAIAVTISSEIILTLYVDLYGLSNILGHLLKITSFILVYNALVRSSLSRPYVTLFREIENEKRAVLESETKFRNMMNNLPLGIHIFQKGEDDQLYFIGANTAADTILGIDNQQLIDKTISEAFPEIADADIQDDFYAIATGEKVSVNKYGITYGDRIYDKYNFQVQDGMMASTFLDITERKRTEKSLEDSERRYSSLVDQSPIAYEVYDADGVQLRVNKAYEDLWGMKVEDSVGIFNVRTDPQVELLGLKPFVERAYTGETVKLPEYEWDPGKSGFPGRARWLSTRIYPLKDKSDNILNVVITHEDVTERKQAEDALRRSEGQKRAIADYTYDWESWLALDGELLWVNPAVEKLTGFSITECENMPNFPLPIVHEDDQRAFGKQLQKAIVEKSSINNFEFRISHKDGSVRWMAASWQPIFDDEKQHLGQRTSIREITEKKQAEQLLISNENKLQRAQNIARLGFWEWDLKTDEGIWSEQVLQMFGYTPEEVEISFEWLLNQMNPHDREQVSKEIGVTIETHKSFDMEYRVTKKDGSEVVVHSVGQVILDGDGKTVGMEGILQDISERKQAEQERLALEAQLRQSQKLEAIGTMVGGISHEFNNVLQSMFLYGGLVQDTLPDDQELRSNFQQILNDGNRARDLIKQILTFSRMTKVEMKTQHLHESVLEAMVLERASLPANIEIQQDIDMNCGLVLCDKTQISQIIMNLCNNAQHAMADKGGKLTIRLKPILASLNNSDPETPVLELTISDTGHGIDDSALDRIFDPFFTTKEFGEGTGLGLSVIHGIVEMMGGQISVTSEIGKGTTFRILFPVTTEVEAAEIVKPAVKAELKSRSILLVDDEDSIRTAIQTILTRRGFNVECAANGKQALELFKADPGKYDLIVTDQSMPKMSGVELTKAIRNTKSDIPIILSTGQLGIEDEKEFKNIGITAFIQKPWTAEELITRIQELDVK